MNSERTFAKHPAWKKAAARQVKHREAARQNHANQDAQFWNEHLDEIVERRQARITDTETTAERLARKRAAWKQDPQL